VVALREGPAGAEHGSLQTWRDGRCPRGNTRDRVAAPDAAKVQGQRHGRRLGQKEPDRLIALIRLAVQPYALGHDRQMLEHDSAARRWQREPRGPRVDPDEPRDPGGVPLAQLLEVQDDLVAPGRKRDPNFALLGLITGERREAGSGPAVHPETNAAAGLEAQAILAARVHLHECSGEALHMRRHVPERAELEPPGIGAGGKFPPENPLRQLDHAIGHRAPEQLAARQIADAPKAVDELGLGLGRQRLRLGQERSLLDVRELPPVQKIAGREGAAQMLGRAHQGRGRAGSSPLLWNR
jgi:hypothetical protein